MYNLNDLSLIERLNSKTLKSKCESDPPGAGSAGSSREGCGALDQRRGVRDEQPKHLAVGEASDVERVED